MKVKALRTESYAQHLPHLPIIHLVKGEVSDVTDILGNEIIKLGGGVLFDDKEVLEETETETAKEEEIQVEPKETAVTASPESKEKPSRKNRGGNRS